MSMRIYLLTHISSTSRSIHTTADGRVRVLSECILLYAHPTMEHGGATANTHDNHTRQSSRSRLDENKVLASGCWRRTRLRREATHMTPAA